MYKKTKTKKEKNNMKNVKTLLILLSISTFILASQQRVDALGGNAAYWHDDDANTWVFPHTVNNYNIANTDGSDFYVSWGDGSKFGFAGGTASDMLKLTWGNGSMGATFGLSMSAADDGDEANGKATSGMGISASWGMEMGFGEVGVGFSTSSYDDGVAEYDDPSTMGLSVNLRRPQSLWIFDNMLVGFAYKSFNATMDVGVWSTGVKDAVTTMELSTSLYTHVDISDNTTGLIAMGFGYKSHANGSYGGAAGSTCDGVDSDDEDGCAGVWVTAMPDSWSAAKGATSSWISLPTWTFAVESDMTDWATARVGVNAGYNLSTSVETTGASGAKATTGRGGMETAFSVGLGFNYGSFNLDVDVSEGLFTNPGQHVTGYESISPTDATATLTYVW